MARLTLAGSKQTTILQKDQTTQKNKQNQNKKHVMQRVAEQTKSKPSLNTSETCFKHTGITRCSSNPQQKPC